MSKLETATGSSASAPSQLIKQLRELQRQMEQSRSEIDQLPPAIAQQVMEALRPLEGLSLGEIEKLAQIQRTTLDAMSTEMVSQATASFEKSTRQLVWTINETAQQLQQSTASLESTALAASRLPETANQLQEQAQAMRSKWWKGPALAAGSAILSAVLVVSLIGILDSSSLALLNVDDPRLDQLLERATQAEFELLKEIYNRPAP